MSELAAPGTGGLLRRRRDELSGPINMANQPENDGLSPVGAAMEYLRRFGGASKMLAD